MKKIIVLQKVINKSNLSKSKSTFCMESKKLTYSINFCYFLFRLNQILMTILKYNLSILLIYNFSTHCRTIGL